MWIEVVRADAKISVSMRDNEMGLPPNFESTSHNGVGIRLINAFTAQLGGKNRRHDHGIGFVLKFPIGAK